MKTNLWILLVATLIFFSGWALRSTVPVEGWDIKPTGGILMAVGMALYALLLARIIKNR